ncbi:MAG: hypothetical protein AAFQ51_15090, partial [Pseudomonadota bacterium]
MIRWALALLALALPAAAQDQVRVRSGEHATFSRIVLEVPWSASQTVLREGRRVRLTLPDVAGNVPTDTVFRRIPRRRIADVDFDANGRVLSLRLACGCEVDVFGLDDRLLVIDVRDPGSRSAQPRNANVVGAPEPQTAEAQPDPPDLQSGRPNRPPRAPRLTPSDATEDAELRAAQRALMEQLTRAVDQGLLEFTEPPEPEPPRQPPRDEVAEPGPDGEAVPQLTMEQLAARLRDAGQIEVQTAIDREVDRDALANRPRDQSHCVPDAKLMVETWSSDRPFADQLASHREGLLGVFDTPDPTRVSRFVRFLLHHDLGTEARAHLSLFGGDLPDLELLTDLTHLSLDEPLPEDGPLRLSDGCLGRAGIWHAAAG